MWIFLHQYKPRTTSTLILHIIISSLLSFSLLYPPTDCGARESFAYVHRKGRVGDVARADDKLEEWENEDSAIKEFSRIFEELTRNEFESWEREKKIQKKPHKFYPLDVADGIEVRYGGLALRQLAVATVHSKQDPMVANFMKLLCSQEIYRYALMETGFEKSGQNSERKQLCGSQ